MESNQQKEEAISAFAYKTARDIEKLINDVSNNLKETNMMLEALILGYTRHISGDELKRYEEYMGITKDRNGNV